MTYTPPLTPKTIQRTRLSNGIQVVLYENNISRSVVLRGKFRAGAIDDALSAPGVAYLTAANASRGTQTHSFSQINQKIENVGADMYLSCGRHFTNFGGKALAEDVPMLIEVLADVLLQPTFPLAELETVRTQALTRLQELENNPRSMAGRTFRRLFYGQGHPYGEAITGSLETLPHVTRQQLQKFHQTYYRPTEAVLVMVGNISLTQAVDYLEDALHQWHAHPENHCAPWPTVNSISETRQAAKQIPGKSQASLILGCLGPRRLDEDYYATYLANILLGQLGLSGRLGESIREAHGLSYYIHSGLAAGRQPGAWSISAGVKAPQVDDTVALIWNVLDDFCKEMPPALEIEEAKSFATGSLPLQMASNEGLANTLMYVTRYDLGDDYVLRFPAAIKAVAHADILEAARRYWRPQNSVLAVAGDYQPSSQSSP